jgi:hypothetical protein
MVEPYWKSLSQLNLPCARGAFKKMAHEAVMCVVVCNVLFAAALNVMFEVLFTNRDTRPSGAGKRREAPATVPFNPRCCCLTGTMGFPNAEPPAATGEQKMRTLARAA